MTRADLLAALAAATGPDRALDFWLWWHCKANVADSTKLPPADHIEANLYRAPRYTGSLDFGRALLPTGTLWAVGNMEEGPFARLCVPNSKGTYEGGYVEAKAATVELALCIAALSARSAP